MKYTLITGASSGIGFELAKEFAKHKHNLILSARSVDKLQKLADELESKFAIDAVVIPMDLAKADGPNKLFNLIQEKNLSVEILVNNAGFGDHNSFQNAQWKKLEEMIQLNITSLTELSKLFLPAMIKKKSGKILNVASTAAFQPGPLMSVYYATKAYVLFLSEGLSEELAGTGVTVTALCPGPTMSGFQDAANMNDVALFSALKIPTSQSVAAYGYRALMKGTPVAVHGMLNQIAAFSIRFTPRSLARKMVMKLQEKRN